MSAPLENAVKSIAKAIEDQTRLLKTLNENIVELVKAVSPREISVVKQTPPQFLGWAVADKYEAQGRLHPGDIKQDVDQVCHVWTGTEWKVLELANAGG